MIRRCQECGEGEVDTTGYLPREAEPGRWCLRCLDEEAVVWHCDSVRGGKVLAYVHSRRNVEAWVAMTQLSRHSSGRVYLAWQNSRLADWVTPSPHLQDFWLEGVE